MIHIEAFAPQQCEGLTIHTEVQALSEWGCVIFFNGPTQGSHMSKREKLFGIGRAIPLDREAKIRILHRGKALMHRTNKGKHYGIITAKAFAVLRALLYGFHNAGSGRCFPSYEAIAVAADCARSTVAEAIKTLERAQLLTWHNRIIRDKGIVVRTSNAYQFVGEASKSEDRTGTQTKILHSLDPLLEASIQRLKEAFQNKNSLQLG